MSTRKINLASVLAIAMTMGAIGCVDAGPTEVVAHAGPSMAQIGVAVPSGNELPFVLNSTAVLLAQTFAPDFGPPLFGRSAFQGRCSGPSDFVIRFGLRGHATHLGTVTGMVEHCSQIDFSTGRVTTTDGVLKLTAANGDELLGHYHGETGPSGSVEEQVTFSGGSGRFASASGDGVGIAACDQAAGTCAFTLHGTIGY